MVKLFGTTIKETTDAFRSVRLGDVNTEAGTRDDKVKAIGRIVISVLMVFLATYLITTKQTANTTLAGTIIGALVGYWIK